MRRNFGSTIHRWIDKTFRVAQANIPLAILEAVRFEPRLIIQSINVRRASQMQAMEVEILWSVSEDAPVQTTTLSSQDFSVTPEARRIITEAMAEAATGLDVSITDYKQEFLTALND